MKILKVPRFIHVEDRIRHYKCEAQKTLTNILGFIPKSKYAKDELNKLSKLLYAKDTDKITEKQYLLHVSDCIVSIRKNIENCPPKYHHLLDIEIDQEFAEKVKPYLIEKNRNQTFIDYQTVCVDYKNKARKLVSDLLGFTPKLRASMDTEIKLRKSLNRYHNNLIPLEKFETRCNIFIPILKKRIYYEVPEQAHLIKIKDIEGLISQKDAPDLKPILKPNLKSV